MEFLLPSGLERAVQEKDPNPTSWSIAEQERMLRYIDILDETDAAFNAFTKANREVRNIVRPGADTKTFHTESQARAVANQTETQWQEAKQKATTMKKELGSLRHLIVALDIGRKTSRDRLRKQLIELQGQHERQEATGQSEIFSEQEISHEATTEDPSAKEIPPLPSQETFVHILQEPLLLDNPPKEIIGRSEEQEKDTLSPTVIEKAKSSSSWRSLLDRITSSPLAKPLLLASAFIGIPLLASQSVERRAERNERTAEIIHEVSKISPLESGGKEMGFTFELPSENDILTFADGHQETRAEALLEIDRAFTKELAERNGPLQSMMEDCGKAMATEEGVQETVVDVFRCQALYGNQYGLHKEGRSILAAVSGYSEEELKLYGQALRGGVLVQPTLTIAGSFAQLIHHDFDTLPDSYHEEREAIYEGYLDDTSVVALGVIRALDLADASRPTQKAAVEALHVFAQTYVEFGNQTLVVGSSIKNLDNTYIVTDLKDGLPDPDTGMRSTSEMETLWDKAIELDLAAKKIVALEKDEDGPLHAWRTSLQQGIDYKIDAMLDAGLQTGKEKGFFTEQHKRLEEKHRS